MRIFTSFAFFQYGWVFGIYSFSAVVSSLISARFGAKIGSRFLYIVCSFVQANGAIFFGFLQYIFNTSVFLVLAYVIRIFTGVAAAGSWGSLLAILMTLFPNKTSKVMALEEMSFGLGFMLGIITR